MAEHIQGAAAELAEEMSDEGHPSPICARVNEIICEQVERAS